MSEVKDYPPYLDYPKPPEEADERGSHQGDDERGVGDASESVLLERVQMKNRTTATSAGSIG